MANYFDEEEHGAKQTNNTKSFESDSEKIVHRHLNDPNHHISEEELQGIHIGMTPPQEEITKPVKDAGEKAADKKATPDEGPLPGAQKATPWDVLGPE